MLHRLSFGSMAIAGLLLVIASDAWVAASWRSFGQLLGPLLQRGSFIPVVFTAIMLGGALEFLRLMRAAGLRPHGVWAMLMIAALMLTPWVYAAWIPTGNLVGVEGLGLQMGWLALTMFGAALLQLRRKVTEGAIHDVAATLLVTVYCGFLPSFLILIRCDTFPPAPQGAWLVLLLLAITKASDIGAYFTGSAVGRHKLIPAISPGKSIEGVVGGLAASVVVTLLLWYFNTVATGVAAPTEARPETVTLGMKASAVLAEILEVLSHMSILQLVFFGIVMSVCGQLGDLLESVFKRAAGAKDSAALIPVFGGILDMVDSPVLAAPAAWFLLTYCWGVV